MHSRPLALWVLLLSPAPACGGSVLLHGDDGSAAAGGDASGGKDGSGAGAGGAFGTGVTASSSSSASTSSSSTGAGESKCISYCDARTETCPNKDPATCQQWCEGVVEKAAAQACGIELDELLACLEPSACNTALNPVGPDEAEACFVEKVTWNQCSINKSLCTDLFELTTNGGTERSCYREYACGDVFRRTSCTWLEGAATADCRCFVGIDEVGTCSATVDEATCSTTLGCCGSVFAP